MDEVATYADAFGIDRGRLGYWRYIYADHGHGHPGRCPGEASWAGVRETRDRGADAGSGHAMNISTGVEPGLSAPTGAAGERGRQSGTRTRATQTAAAPRPARRPGRWFSCLGGRDVLIGCT